MCYSQRSRRAPAPAQDFSDIARTPRWRAQRDAVGASPAARRPTCARPVRAASQERAVRPAPPGGRTRVPSCAARRASRRESACVSARAPPASAAAWLHVHSSHNTHVLERV